MNPFLAAPSLVSDPPIPAAAPSSACIAENLAAIHARIAVACADAGRDTQDVRLLPVSKTQPPEVLRAAFAAGCHAFGENKAQEADHKQQALADLDIRWSIIGHLQTNKAKQIAAFAHEFQALDSLRLGEALDRYLQQQGRGLDVLVQVNTSNEASKFGLAPENAANFIKRLPAFSALRIRGLMTMAMLSGDTAKIRLCFRRLRELRDRLRQDLPNGIVMEELSMGMSGDFELAIAEGATVVRIGQAIFGPRSTR